MEVKSPSDSQADLQTNMLNYLANGALLGFLLEVAAETGQGYDQELSGEPVLTDFALDLRPLRRPVIF